MAMLDLRRTDQRSYPWHQLYWLTSAELVGPDTDDATAVLFSFPLTRGKVTLLYEAVFETGEAFDGTSDILVGIGTIATDAAETGDTVSVVDADEIFQTGEITLTANAISYLSGNDMLTALAAGLPGVTIAHTDSTVPVVYATHTASTAVTTGQGRLHLLMSTIPFILNPGT